MTLPMISTASRNCAAAVILLVTSIAAGGCVCAQPAPASVERYGGEARLGSEPPFPVHLEVRRTPDRVSGVISSYGTAFSLEDGQGSDIVTAALGAPGGDPIVLRFSDGRVEGEFRLGEQEGTLQAMSTALDAAAYFAEPGQRLDISPAEWSEDLDRLVEILVTRHGSPFHRVSEEEFQGAVERIRDDLPGLSGPQAALALRRLVAMIGDGHTTLEPARGRPQFPLEAYWFEDGIRLVSITAEHRDLTGARLVAIEDVPVDEVVRRLRAYVPQGESAWSYRFVAPYLFAEPDVLADAGIGCDEECRFTFETTEGRTRQISLTASSERLRWATLGGSLPFWLQAPQDGFRTLPLADGSLYVNWRTYDDLDERASGLLAELEREQPPRLIVDFRDSGGGDFNLGRRLIGQLASLPWLNHPDRLYVLTGRRTFSAAMTNAVDFRIMTNATLVGEPPGAAPNNWQEVRFFHLPHSGLRVGVSTLYYEFLPGEDAVHPDIFVPPVPEDWGNEYDAAVRHILGLA